MTFKPFNKLEFPENLRNHINSMACDPNNITSKAGDDTDVIKSRINVVDEDVIKWTYIIHNEQGDKIYEHSQVTKDCPEFQKLKKLYGM